MELIRISDSKLKIMLTPMDMRQFELSTDNFYDDSEKMHRSFRLLLDEVRR
jgi:negative regulator of genetic competence, sporulation and motility